MFTIPIKQSDPYKYYIKKHGSISRQVCTQRNRPVYLYASQRIASIRDYRISITVKSIKFWVGLFDNLGLNYIIKVFLFFFCVLYKRRYRDAKFESGTFKKRHSYTVIFDNTRRWRTVFSLALHWRKLFTISSASQW